MKFLPLLILPLLAACGADGNFQNPTTMSKAERCANYRMVLLAATVNKINPETIAKAQINVDMFCPVPVPAPAP